LVIFAAQITLMKKNILTAFCFLVTLTAIAQKPAPKKNISKPATTSGSAPILKTENDSLSYAIGLSVANFYRQQGVKINTALVTKACNDVLSNKKPLITDDQANLLFMCHSNPQLCAHVKEDEKFLTGNKKKPNIKITPSGLQYEVVKQGTGMRPTATDTVTVNYKGTLTNGTEFDNSYKRGQPASFSLDHVIRGWTEGLQLMTVGSKYIFYIPYQLGYGLNEMGTIPAGSALVFEVELLDVKRPN
jgi:FKBP-type peptidyl-prolyl cis-trans isomerase